MDLIPEDGTGRADANSYVSLEFADAYFLNHPFYADAWDALLDDQKKQLLSSASFTLDSIFTWYGLILRTEQALGWPRVGVIDHEGRTVASNAVPLRVKQAVCELAYHLSKGDPFMPPASAGLEQLRIDVVELRFAQSTKPVPAPPATLTLLRGLGDYAFGGRVRKVLVG